MQLANSFRVGYVVKRYPRYSETFIVNEILAHEAAGLDLEVFSLRPPIDTHFQPAISRVKASVTYLADKGKMSDFWSVLKKAARVMPDCPTQIPSMQDVDVNIVYQGVQLATAIRERGIKHLHAHFGTSATDVARVAAKLAGITYSFTAHAKDIFHESVSEDDLRARLRDASSTITVSDFNLEYFRATYGEDASRVVRIFNGLELDRFPYASPVNRAPRIVAVGRLVEKKGFGDLIDACAMLADRGAVFKCQIIGEGELEAALRQQISDLGLNYCVELMGPRPQSEIVGLLQGAAAFAAPCVIGEDGNRDGLPTVLLESMALGTPCISTDVTGIPEILHHEKTGLLVGQKDVHALAAAIERLIEDAPLRVKLAEAARELMEAQFDIHLNTEKIRAQFIKQTYLGDSVPASELLIEANS